jgi:hypothetical protein
MKSGVLDLALAQALDSAGEDPVEAVFQLKQAKDTRAVVNGIVHRAQARASTKVDSLSIFENIHAFAARATAPLIKELAKSKEVRSVRLNKLEQSPLIRPVRSKRVSVRNLKKYAK